MMASAQKLPISRYIFNTGVITGLGTLGTVPLFSGLPSPSGPQRCQE